VTPPTTPYGPDEAPEGRMLYDVTAPLEYALAVVGAVLIAVAAASLALDGPVLAALSMALAGVLAVLAHVKRFVDCRYRVRPGAGELVYERRFGTRLVGRSVARFADVAFVAVSCRRRAIERVGRRVTDLFGMFVIVVGLRSGRIVEVSDSTRDFAVLAMRARDLADMLGAPYLPPRDDYRVVVCGNGAEAVGSYEALDGRPVEPLSPRDVAGWVLLGLVGLAGLVWLHLAGGAGQ